MVFNNVQPNIKTVVSIAVTVVTAAVSVAAIMVICGSEIGCHGVGRIYRRKAETYNSEGNEIRDENMAPAKGVAAIDQSVRSNLSHWMQ
ncbi:hypothetical protein E3N88_15293 [Mikania micrantha]|uniref:Uncharacterized protein n=1 Tax=Mikania micrantha TaxID=192012 RepID=A0A5N6NX94_9ASTR|nr:hypothetical protein E3N88_15293 [Mikania micrantha]